jgi:hypothetical protein
MAHTSVFNIQELLEQILHFLAIDKSLYPTLYVSQLWYRCGALILWKCIELKGNEVEDKYRLEKFMKLVHGVVYHSWGRRKPIYSLKLTCLKISHYRLSNKKIKGIVRMFPNVIHLDFEESIDPTGKALKLIVGSYPNLKYLNISAPYGRF